MKEVRQFVPITTRDGRSKIFCVGKPSNVGSLECVDGISEFCQITLRWLHRWWSCFRSSVSFADLRKLLLSLKFWKRVSLRLRFYIVLTSLNLLPPIVTHKSGDNANRGGRWSSYSVYVKEAYSDLLAQQSNCIKDLKYGTALQDYSTLQEAMVKPWLDKDFVGNCETSKCSQRNPPASTGKNAHLQLGIDLVDSYHKSRAGNNSYSRFTLEVFIHEPIKWLPRTRWLNIWRRESFMCFKFPNR